MNNNDIRKLYKKDTGENANAAIIDDIELSEDLTIGELSGYITVDINVGMDDIPYICWLEEQYLKIINNDQTTTKI